MPNEGSIDMELVARLVSQKRKGQSLRDAAALIGISAPTLQRIEAGQLPTPQVLLKIADWVGVPLDQLRKGTNPPRDTVAQIEVFLRADRNLDRKAADSIATIVREVYDGFVKGRKK